MRGILKRHRKAFWLVLVSVLSTVIILGIIFLQGFQSPFHLSVYEQVQLGMTLEEVTTILSVPPGRYNVSPREAFVNMRHEGKIAFGNQDYEEVEKESAVYDIISRKTGKPVAAFRTWANGEDGITVLTQENKVIGKMYLVSESSWNRGKRYFNKKDWLTDLRRRLGL
jgi:hypothetical protein